MRALPEIHAELAARVEKLNAEFEPGQQAVQVAVKPQDFLVLCGAGCPPSLAAKRQLAIDNPMATHVVLPVAEAEQLLSATTDKVADVLDKRLKSVLGESGEQPEVLSRQPSAVSDQPEVSHHESDE